MSVICHFHDYKALAHVNECPNLYLYVSVIFLMQPSMDTRATIAQLSDSDLAMQLKSWKEDIGPITPNSRPLYERKLMKYLILEEASSCTIPYTPPNTDDVSQMSTGDNKLLKCEDLCHTNGSVVNAPRAVSNDGDVNSNAGASGVFFGVQLQSDAPQSSCENSLNYCN